MTEPKHTPGPWHINFNDYTKPYIAILNEDNVVIAQIPDGEVIRGDTTILGLENIEANIDLIADAWQLPDLRREIKELKAINKEMYDVLKACEEIQGDVLMEVSTSKRIFNAMVEYNNKLNKALRKARGEEE